MTDGPTLTAQPATTGVYALGEGPVWDPERQRLLWVDILAATVHTGQFDPATGQIKQGEEWNFHDGFVGAVAVAAGGELIVAERATLTRVDPGGTRTTLARVLPPARASRLNDGAVDPAGRFMVGSLALDDRHGREVLVRLDGRECTVLDADLTLSNGLGWSPAGNQLYSIDTVPGVVWVRDYDPTTGAVGPRRVLFPVSDGSPDGMCVDADGNLWIAIWGRGRVECRDPGGSLLATVEVAAPNTSSVAFAGPELDVLVITTANEHLTSDEQARYPDSGRLFMVRPGVRGRATPYWVP